MGVVVGVCKATITFEVVKWLTWPHQGRGGGSRGFPPQACSLLSLDASLSVCFSSLQGDLKRIPHPFPTCITAETSQGSVACNYER